MTLSGRRIADDKIYVAAEQRVKPKEIFAKAAAIIDGEGVSRVSRWLDVGCAAGEFLNFLSSQFPAISLIGADVSETLLAEAQRRHPGIEWRAGDVQETDLFSEDTADVTTIFGVLNCLDDPTNAIRNLVRWTRPGGRVLILDIINNDPIDVVMRHRRSDQPGAEWECGWNVFSRVTLDRILVDEAKAETWTYIPFELSFDLPKRDDVMRTWTIKTQDSPRQLTNGALQLVNMQFVLVRLGA